MPKFNLAKYIADAESRIPDQNYALGKGLLQPFRGTNSGSRAIMQNVQLDQRLSLMDPEPPIIATGHENRYGQMSSNYIVNDSNKIVIDKISKYPWDISDTRRAYIVTLDPVTNEIDILERKPYEHVSESFGYTFNSKYLDGLMVGDIIPEGKITTKTRSFDDNDLRQDGLNLRTIYVASGLTTEDPVIVSKSTAEKFASPLIDSIRVMINDNDILLNLFGGDRINEYKTFPDIGEEITDGILCCIRREKKDEEALFAQSWERLKTLMVSDEPYSISGGRVVDVDVRCNNPEALKESVYNQQIYKYYLANKEFATNVVKCIKPLLDKGCTPSYRLGVFLERCQDMMNDVNYINEKVFNNIIMDITVMRVIPLHKGDKITDRYGGKGVVSEILDDNMMPKIMIAPNMYEPVDIVYNKCTCVNRLNPGQLFEVSLTYISEKILEFIADNHLNHFEASSMIYKYLTIVSPLEAESFRTTYDHMMDEDKEYFINSIIDDGFIYLVVNPFDEMSLDKLRELYKEFPFVQQAKVLVKQKDSNGNYRDVPTNRLLTAGHKYIYRLKQFAEEKFSVVSLASTNIRGENTKSKASKQHKILFPSTPVRFGEMEWGDLIHISAVEQMIQILMLLSTSPGARRLCENLLTGDPLKMDVKLDNNSTSRSAEIVAAYLKTMGLRLTIKKIPKKRKGALRHVISRVPKKAPLEVIRRIPYEVLEKDMDRLIIADSESRNSLKRVINRIHNCDTIEQAQQEILRLKQFETAHIIDLAKDMYGVDNVDDILSLINSGKTLTKPIQVAQRAVIERVPTFEN